LDKVKINQELVDGTKVRLQKIIDEILEALEGDDLNAAMVGFNAAEAVIEAFFMHRNSVFRTMGTCRAMGMCECEGEISFETLADEHEYNSLLDLMGYHTGSHPIFEG